MTNVRMLACGSYQANAYLLWQDDRDDLLVIDPGDDLAKLEDEIRLTGKRLTDILVTHGHFDHIFAAAELKDKYGARICIHPLDADMLGDEALALIDPPACSHPFVPTVADELYPEGSTFDLTVCGIVFNGLHTPGHSPGGVTLVCPEANAVFTGDTLFSRGYGRYDFKGGDLHQLMRSLRTILRLPGELTVFSGHGDQDVMKEIAGRWHMK